MQLKRGDFIVWVRGPNKGLYGVVAFSSWDGKYVALDSQWHVYALGEDIVVAEDDFEQWAIVERVKAGFYD